MTEPDPHERPGRRWPVITASVVLVLGALALVLLTDSPDQPVRVVYQVSGTATRATVTYSTFQGDETRQEELTGLPWRLEIIAPEEPDHGVLTVTIGPDGGNVACEVSVADVVRRSATATDAHTRALCGF
ncbi:hypothetical protein F4560_006019 [Saccharothrix ecbatanensis]|uniref:MmpS family membrane protein n=1 Tax=Saccharothrix ecbatanensis TaxID=1105145 RepID=A0A7W9HQA3_9PSEU|nr:MmpS family transport accessory protein [Saccharothrix ecbatanensis]MBB5806251.1 hypothetical protein [Saccharothrix ecbatanensis]